MHLSELFCFSEKRITEGKGERGSSCWGLAFCIAEIVDAILRDTKVVLPVSTYIHVSIRIINKIMDEFVFAWAERRIGVITCYFVNVAELFSRH